MGGEKGCLVIMKSVLLVLMSTLVAFPGFAQIGKTVEQCRALYGKEVLVDSPTKWAFNTNNLLVMVEFSSGVARRVCYKERDDRYLSREVVTGLMNLNSAEPWQEDILLSRALVNTTIWRSQKTGIVATCLRDILIVETAAAWSEKVAAKPDQPPVEIKSPLSPFPRPKECLTGSAPSAREVKRNEYYVTISIALNVKSSFDRDVTARAKVQAVDKDGFEMVYTYLEGPVPKGLTKTITGTALTEPAVAARIVRWQLQSLSED
jgi:hypothetical protein